MTSWLRNSDAMVREAALERLCMAVFRSEPAYRSDAVTQAQGRVRASWLLGEVDEARRAHPELLPAFLLQLRWHGNNGAFPEVLLSWLRALEDADGPSRELVEGVILLVGRENVASATLWRTLDHPSSFVRACAAYLIGQTGMDDPNAFDQAFIDDLTVKELARPGIAGPFWSGWSLTDYTGLTFDPLLWVLDVIERRSGPEPDSLPYHRLPFKGLDFLVHELTDHSPAGVRRLLAAGRVDLAVRGATEHGGVVDGMAEVLHDLAALPALEIALAAHDYLARYYAVRSAQADPARIHHVPDWRQGVDAFLIRRSEGSRHADLLVLYSSGKPFDDEAARALIDAALPPPIRGELVRHRLAEQGSAPAPVCVGHTELRAYASGAQVGWDGEVEARLWRRLEIHDPHGALALRRA